jgi:hypothetical protein
MKDMKRMKKIDKSPRLTLSGIQSYFFMSFMLFMVKFKDCEPENTTRAIEIPPPVSRTSTLFPRHSTLIYSGSPLSRYMA